MVLEAPPPAARPDDEHRVPISDLYRELQRVAARALSGHGRRVSVRPTELVHELFLKLAGGQKVDWRGRAEFLALAAHAMRGILMNYVAARHAQKRGGGCACVTLDGITDPSSSHTIDLLCLDEALRAFEESHQRESRILEMRFFGGMAVEEIAAFLGVSDRTVQRDLHYARNWLFRRIEYGCGNA